MIHVKQERNLKNGPVYCGECRSQNSWERFPDGDILSVNGKLLWEKWKCRTCGATTIRPVDGRVHEHACRLANKGKIKARLADHLVQQDSG